MKELFVKPIVWFIKLYQYLISPWLGANCRFSPTCSQYTIHAFQKLPLHIALIKSIWRILRCHPWSAGGHDPIINKSTVGNGASTRMNQRSSDKDSE